MKSPAAVILLALSAVQASVSSASGQAVLVRVTASESGTPIAGAFVSILDERDVILHSGLTDASGYSLLPVGSPGTVRVKAEMIGRETTRSAALAVGAGDTARIDLAVPTHAVPLDAIRVEADQRCRIRPEDASGIARIWDEARKALAVQAWAERETRYRLQITTYDRDLDAAGRTVERETRRGATAVTRIPFESLPAEDLLAGGFVRPTKDGGHQYFGPDAAVLLSDLFLDTHCFRLVRSRDRPGSMGLAFEPVGGADLPDIAGTFWLDKETSRLESLDYRYTRAPFPEADGVAGGHVEFQAMPDGAWIIDRWWIRAPIMAQYFGAVRLGQPRIRVDGIRESGGEVLGASTLNRQAIAEAIRASLTGLVWDSIRAAPLEGATVLLRGTAYRAITDANGRFRIDGLPDGRFTAGFEHPRLDSLAAPAPDAEVELVRGEVAELRLAVPSMATIMLASCHAEERKEDTAVLAGTVRDRTSGKPVPGATVRVDWQVVAKVEPYIQTFDRWIEARSDADGHYVACGIQPDELLDVRAGLGDLRGNPVKARFAEAGYQRLDLELDLPSALRITPDPSPASGATITQGVQGLLLDRVSGAPVRSAVVALLDSAGPRSTPATAVTDGRGFFRLGTPAPGSYRLSASALGYADLAGQAVDVSEGKLTVLEIRMSPAALELEPIVVTAEPRNVHLEMEGFYDRRKGGVRATFLTPDQIEIRHPRKVPDLLAGIPGVRETIIRNRRVQYFREGIRMNDNSICWPMVWVDRLLVSSGGSGIGADPFALNDAVSASDVSAVEVYTGAIIPAEFRGANANCGVVVIWTHRR